MADRAIEFRVWLKAGRERSVERRHPWVYSGAIERLEGRPGSRAGGLGEIVSASGEWLATAIVDPQASLVGRILRFEPGPVDAAWFSETLARAVALRGEIIPPGTDAYRLIHAEGDGLPGLIVDRYGAYLGVQWLTAGMERLKELWLAALVSRVRPRGIVVRGGGPGAGGPPGLPGEVAWGEAPPQDLVVHECGLRFRIDLLRGQKTGFYLDQRENRRRLAPLARGRRMLNAFAYTNAFGVHAGRAGARQVVAVETSARALSLAEENWRLNDLPADRLELVREPVQRYLRRSEEPFELIVLDPPAFAKAHGQRDRAARAYKDLNLWALRRLAPGGWLATFSCSQHVDASLFQKILFGASLDARRPVQWLGRWGAGGDHPVHLDHPQGEYLTGYLLRAPGRGPEEMESDGEGPVVP
ncbi:MAG: class I SAM-dependent rRNA methyltransferase [Candidatus Eisenbacteria sp.]|nr:class I SAM-dependent rRNA methyltransferase [Candidatus Eisenbacteria bacterium]